MNALNTVINKDIQSVGDEGESNNEDAQSIQSGGALSMHSTLSGSGLLALDCKIAQMNDIEKQILRDKVREK